MALTAALIITSIAVSLLVIYGVDVIVGYSADNGEGFIPFDHKTRGMGLGLPALILPIIAYFISRKINYIRRKIFTCEFKNIISI